MSKMKHCYIFVSTDLAVGAPYEGTGAVYIFRGGQKGIVAEYSQRIAATDLLSARPLASFGSSISGGIDMDGNGYNMHVFTNRSNAILCVCTHSNLFS